MKRFLFGLVLCLLSVSVLAGRCKMDEMYADCGKDEKGEVHCRIKEFVGVEERLCEAPPEYKDKDGKYHFDGEDGGRLILPPKEKQPKGEGSPSPAPPSPARKCYRSGTINARPGSDCSKGGWVFEEYSGGKIAFCTNTYKPLLEMPCTDEQPKKPKEPKQPKQNEPKQPAPNDGKQPKHEEGKQPKGEGQGDSSEDGNGKGSKGEGNGKGEGSGDGSGKGSKGEGNGNGEGSKGEGNGKGEGSGDAEGKGMFKGGAGSGQIGDVRVPKSRDGMGWKADFFLRNPNQCPQDKTMHVLGRTINFSYSKLCSFLDMLAPVIKAIFMFIAGMLVVKSIRAK